MRFAPAFVLLVATAAHAESPSWNAHCPPGVRWDFALCRDLEPSGPDRGTLHRASWGTAFFKRTSPLEVTQTASDKLVTTDAGTVSGRPALDGGYTLTREAQTGSGSSRELRVRPIGQDLIVDFDSQRYEFDRRPDGLSVRLGDKSLTYVRNPAGFTIAGPAGAVTYSRDLTGTEVITSPAGESRLERSPYTGVKVSGIAVSRHPHLGRVALFALADSGVMVDLWAMAGIAPGDGIAGALYWRAAATIGDDAPQKSPAP